MKLRTLLCTLAALWVVGCAADAIDETEREGISEQQEELRGRMCRSEADCPPILAPCHACKDGSFACPEVDCVQNRCVYSLPQCPTTDPCATVRCAAGTHCDSGACIPDVQKVFCGGIAGIPCPGGGRCADDPSDSCDPTNGGADCGGMCVCIQNALCVQGSHWDPSPNVCACVPDHGTPCGKAVCGAGQDCCNASCSMCVPKGMLCIQIACE